MIWKITFQTPLNQVHHSLLIKSLRFWNIGSLNFGAEQYDQVFATLMLKVVVINSDYIGISKNRLSFRVIQLTSKTTFTEKLSVNSG